MTFDKALRKGGKPVAQKEKLADRWYPAKRHKFGVERLCDTAFDNERDAQREARRMMLPSEPEDLELVG